MNFKYLVLTVKTQSQEIPRTGKGALGHRNKYRQCMKANVKTREHYSLCDLHGDFKAGFQQLKYYPEVFRKGCINNA